MASQFCNVRVAYSNWKLLFQLFHVGWLSPKLATILARPKQRNDFTGCITLMPCWEFRVILREETSVWNRPLPPSSPIFRTSESCKAVNNSNLWHEEVKSWFWALSVYLIKYTQDILCNQANESELLNPKQYSDTHKVKKKTWKQEKQAFYNIIRSAAARIAATPFWVFESLRFEETGRFCLLCELHRGQHCATVTVSLVVSAISYKL